LDQYGAERCGKLIFDTIRKSVGPKGLKVLLTKNKQYNSVIFVNENENGE